MQLELMDPANQTSFMVMEAVPELYHHQNFGLLYEENFTTWSFPYKNYLCIAAIRFVLSDLFQNLRNEDRHALLHVILYQLYIFCDCNFLLTFI